MISLALSWTPWPAPQSCAHIAHSLVSPLPLPPSFPHSAPMSTLDLCVRAFASHLRLGLHAGPPQGTEPPATKPHEPWLESLYASLPLDTPYFDLLHKAGARVVASTGTPVTPSSPGSATPNSAPAVAPKVAHSPLVLAAPALTVSDAINSAGFDLFGDDDVGEGEGEGEGEGGSDGACSEEDTSGLGVALAPHVRGGTVSSGGVGVGESRPPPARRVPGPRPKRIGFLGQSKSVRFAPTVVTIPPAAPVSDSGDTSGDSIERFYPPPGEEGDVGAALTIFGFTPGRGAQSAPAAAAACMTATPLNATATGGSGSGSVGSSSCLPGTALDTPSQVVVDLVRDVVGELDFGCEGDVGDGGSVVDDGASDAGVEERPADQVEDVDISVASLLGEFSVGGPYIMRAAALAPQPPNLHCPCVSEPPTYDRFACPLPMLLDGGCMLKFLPVPRARAWLSLCGQVDACDAYGNAAVEVHKQDEVHMRHRRHHSLRAMRSGEGLLSPTTVSGAPVPAASAAAAPAPVATQQAPASAAPPSSVEGSGAPVLPASALPPVAPARGSSTALLRMVGALCLEGARTLVAPCPTTWLHSCLVDGLALAVSEWMLVAQLQVFFWLWSVLWAPHT